MATRSTLASGRPSLWRRLFGKVPPPPAIPAPAAAPQHLGSADEVFLAKLVADLSDGKRRDRISTPEVLGHLDGLWTGGHERLAIEWMEKLLSVPEVPADATTPLRAALVERYEQRGELDSALPHLDRLTGDERYALRAYYLLAEHARKRGDHERALRHYETVLGRDVDYPNVRARVERLRALTGRAAPAVGETIAAGDLAGVQAGARYRLVRELGRGATGVVYLARDAELERDVAIKLLHPHLAGTERADALARFFHEARVMASLRHPNVVAVLDLDEASRRIVMELAAGGTLRDVQRERGPRTLRRAIERHGQILSALAAAHRRGIVHCDLKPANLMFRRDAELPGVEIMLGDFGVAHLPDASGRAATGARTEAVGTLAYMAPEQRRGEITPATDVYASAVVLYEMFTGRTPWARETIMAGTRSASDFRLPDSVFAGAPGLADELQHHIMRLGDPDPERRPTTSQALAESQRLRERIIAAGAP
ncbi:MAG TPA: serine/threonine-protein kinase [Kofleriaceae bacterium]|nr:serine/threonine-protein kinase [Kofleriaceae bacterium]